MLVFILTGLSFAVLLALRVYLVLPRGAAPPKRTGTASLAVFLGSGGHTAEMRTLLSAVDKRRYTPRTYVYCTGDTMSLRAVADVEGPDAGGLEQATAGGASASGSRTGTYTLLALPRARKVGEGKASTLISASRTLIIALWYTFMLPLVSRPSEPWADVLLINGPGTAVILVAVAYIRRVLGLKFTRIIYVESFARVTSLSLSGRLLRPFVDTFVVQWPNAGVAGAIKTKEPVVESPRHVKNLGSRTVYLGWVV